MNRMNGNNGNSNKSDIALGMTTNLANVNVLTNQAQVQIDAQPKVNINLMKVASVEMDDIDNERDIEMQNEDVLYSNAEGGQTTGKSD